jgi:hypothetical protein
LSCPNCYCAECSKERAKWTAPPVPYAVPTPWVQPTAIGNGWFCGSCQTYHPAGFSCVTVGKTTAIPLGIGGNGL